MREPWSSRAGKFEDVYRADVEAELKRLEPAALEAVLKLLDLELFLLGPRALADPERAVEFGGAALTLNELIARLSALTQPPAAPQRAAEGEYEDE